MASRCYRITEHIQFFTRVHNEPEYRRLDENRVEKKTKCNGISKKGKVDY